MPCAVSLSLLSYGTVELGLDVHRTAALHSTPVARTGGKGWVVVCAVSTVGGVLVSRV